MGQPATLAFPSSAEMESRQQKFEQGAASKLGITVERLRQALAAAERGRIEADAGRGTMPKEIADRLKAGVDERVDRLMQQRLPAGLGIQLTTATAAVVSPNPMPRCN